MTTEWCLSVLTVLFIYLLLKPINLSGDWCKLSDKLSVF